MSKAAIGNYTERVTIYQDPSTRSVSDDGQKPEDGEVYCTRWARRLPVSGSERFQNLQVQAEVTHRLRIHSDTQTRAITPAMWLVTSDGTRLDLLRIFDPDDRRMELELECKERV